MCKESKTFTLGEREPRIDLFNENIDIHYCAYCGEKAIFSYEFEDRERLDYYHCGCDTAKREMAMKEKIAKANNELYKLNRELKEIQDSKSSDLPKQMKAKNEINKILDKYKVKLRNDLEFTGEEE